MTWDVIEGECVAAMGAMESGSVDAIVCDPPYDLLQSKHGNRLPQFGNGVGAQQERAGRGTGGFMGMKWDGTGVAFDPATWAEALRVAKPGAHLLAFGGTRTFHRMTVAIEDAGWEIRDVISWLYASGFPKSHNLDGDHAGWGTALKPAWEPIIVARKPFKGTVAANVATHGVGAINVDGCRIETSDPLGGGGEVRVSDSKPAGWDRPWMHDDASAESHASRVRENVQKAESLGRWPANVMLDEGAAAQLDEATGTLKSGYMEGTYENDPVNCYGKFGAAHHQTYGDEGGASRFFYVAKPSVAEREAGLGALPLKKAGVKNDSGRGYSESDPYREIKRRNTHPTVKPVALMRQLCRLVTPPGGIVLDPFAGSGTTGVAALSEGFDFIGVEREAEYAAIARQRIAATVSQSQLFVA